MDGDKRSPEFFYATFPFLTSEHAFAKDSDVLLKYAQSSRFVIFSAVRIAERVEFKTNKALKIIPRVQSEVRSCYMINPSP